MNAAIQKLILRLRENPVDDLILDRIVRLLREEPDSYEKVMLSLQLVRALEIAQPKLALALARVIYEHDPQNLDCLEIIAQIFERLGKKAKAEIMRIEMKKLQQILQSEMVNKKQHSTVVEESHAKTTLDRQRLSNQELMQKDREFSKTVHSLVSILNPAVKELGVDNFRESEFSHPKRNPVKDFEKVLRTSVASASVLEVRKPPRLTKMAVFNTRT